MLKISLLLILALINFFIVKKINFLSEIINILDIPDKDRKLHLKPIFLGGGIILYFNYILIISINSYFEFSHNNLFLINNYQSFVTWFVVPSALFLVGLIDDKYDLSPYIKLMLLTIIYLFGIFTDKELLITHINLMSVNYIYYLGSFSILFTLFSFLIFTNAFNMLDGIDLNVGLYALIVIFLILLRVNFNFSLMLILFSVIIFLFLNFKRKVFLGDSGANLLSAIIAILFIKNFNINYLFKSDEILMIMLLPGLEIIRLFYLRILNKKNPFKADRNHLHYLILDKFKSINIQHYTVSVLINFVFLSFTCMFFFYKTLLLFVVASVFYFILISFLYKN
jgi:UDP-GlcNAc:undecaprenyl-phosphate/decaprenyl-phosphate GlcNAc-1-phosphate transferase